MSKTRKATNPARQSKVKAAPVSKQEAMIALLKRPKGTTMEELMSATGWQRHSVHGAISGVLRKRLGLEVITEYGDRGRSYRIAGAR